jgi:esterase/lipase
MTTQPLDHPLAPPPRARGRRRLLGGGRLVAIVCAAVVCVCVAYVGLAWRSTNELMHGPPAYYAWSLQSYPALARVAEPLIVHSRTGVTLVGRFFPGRSDATIVMSHGYGADEDEMLPVANMLHAAGFTVVTYNERGRDGSGGAGTWGALETQDLRSVVNTVVRHPHVDPNEIGEFGFSIGADISILEAAADPRIKAVVADGSWPSLSGYMQSHLIDAVIRPMWAFSPLALKLFEIRAGVDLGQVRPVSVIARISPRPILLVQGLDDTDVKPHSAIVNYDTAKEPKQLWMVKGEGHEATVSPGGASTRPRVGAFFARALLHER